ncbi:hypothetical protein NKH18_51355 [Streptomyces sp. M10(2022)]
MPDYLAVFGGGMWLLDVRPMELIKDDYAVNLTGAGVSPKPRRSQRTSR